MLDFIFENWISIIIVLTLVVVVFKNKDNENVKNIIDSFIDILLSNNKKNDKGDNDNE